MDQILIEVLKNGGPQSVIMLLGIIALGKMMKSDRSELGESAQTLKADLKEHNEAIQRLNLSITRLDLQMENLTKALAKTEKLEKDVNECFSQIREMKQRDN